MANDVDGAPDLDFPVNSVLVDNWLLESASGLLRTTGEAGAAFYRAPTSDAGEQNSVGSEVDPNGQPQDDRILALLSLLDTVILHDRLIYDGGRSWTWKQGRALDPISWLFSECALSPEVRAQLGAVSVDPINPAESMVQGASFNLSLSDYLGVYYWPSPARARYISESLLKSARPSFPALIARKMDADLHAMIEAFQRELASDGVTNDFGFMGFAASVVLECTHPNQVLPAALEFRNNRACVAFREWLIDVDGQLLKGDLSAAARRLQGLQGVLDDVRRELGLDDGGKDSPRLTLGASPNISVTTEWIRGRWPFRPLHLVFVRRHLRRVLKNVEVSRRLEELFAQRD